MLIRKARERIVRLPWLKREFQAMLDDAVGEQLLRSTSRRNGSSLAQFLSAKTKWWVILVYLLLGICQACTWNIFGPIYPATFVAFPSWTSGYLTWMINSANLALCVFLYPVARGVRAFGVRRTMLFSAGMVLASVSLRCVPLADGTTKDTSE